MTPVVHAPPRPPSERRTNGRIPPAPPDFGGDGDDDPVRHVRWLQGTAALGALFLAVQGYEWIRLIGFGLSLASGVYGTTFFALIGLHGLHVLAALVWLLVTTALVARGRFGEGHT